MDMAAVRRAVGARMRAVAEARGMDAGRVALLLNEQPATVRQWWNGKRLPTKNGMDAYAAAFGLTAGDFFGEGLSRPFEAAELGISPAEWAELSPADRQTLRQHLRALLLLARQERAASITPPSAIGSPDAAPALAPADQ